MGKNQNQIYIERNDDGDYAMKEGGTGRASAIEPTQKEAIERARDISERRDPRGAGPRHQGRRPRQVA
jgi:hypothetical protein